MKSVTRTACAYAIARFAVGVLATSLFCVSAARPALAAWPHDPNNGNVALCTATGDQLYPNLISDGSGGAIVTWYDNRSGNYDIYAQRINAAGVPQWSANGVALCAAPGNQTSPTIAPDGAGGAIVTWTDGRNGANNSIYAQRVNASGIAQWAANGVALAIPATNQISPTLTADGAGGAIVTWQDQRAGDFDVYAQRVSATGVPQWASSGVALCVQPNDQFTPIIIPDAAGGAIVTWQDSRNISNTHCYAQRVNAAGIVQWTVNGVALCTNIDAQVFPAMVSDGAGGAIVSWGDFRGVGSDIYAQRVTAAGSLQWPAAAVQITNQGNDQGLPMMVSDGLGGAIMTWQDSRSGGFDVYAQRVNSSGVVQWTASGIPICTLAGDQRIPTIASDGSGGAIITWDDFRSGISNDIYAQRVNTAGATMWTANGVPVSTASNNQQSPTILADGSGGAILSWYDYRGGPTADIYAQRIEHFGYLGSPEPLIANVLDVPNDQGGSVKVSWYASWLDQASDPNLAAYDIYRSAPGSVAAAAVRQGAHSLAGFGETPPATGRSFVLAPASSELYAWEYVGLVSPVHFLSAYGFIATTTGDSIANSNPPSIFMVVGRNSSGSMYWLSLPDSGYSVDNVGPLAPAPFTAAYASGTTHLHWGENHESDLAGYRLYRGGSAGFVPGPVNLVAAQPDTGYGDIGPAGAWYKLSAIDIHGNESMYAILGQSGTLDAPESGPLSFSIEQIRPNPSSGARLNVMFALPTDAPARLELIDVSGRRVRESAIGSLGAGRHAVDLAGDSALAPGLYLIRLTQGAEVRVARVAVVR